MINPFPPKGSDINVFHEGKLIGKLESLKGKKESKEIEFTNGSAIKLRSSNAEQNIRGMSASFTVFITNDEE